MERKPSPLRTSSALVVATPSPIFLCSSRRASASTPTSSFQALEKAGKAVSAPYSPNFSSPKRFVMT